MNFLMESVFVISSLALFFFFVCDDMRGYRFWNIRIKPRKMRRDGLKKKKVFSMLSMHTLPVCVCVPARLSHSILFRSSSLSWLRRPHYIHLRPIPRRTSTRGPPTPNVMFIMKSCTFNFAEPKIFIPTHTHTHTRTGAYSNFIIGKLNRERAAPPLLLLVLYHIYTSLWCVWHVYLIL